MIDLTHVRKEYSESSSVITGDNFDSLNSKQLGSQVNDSKLQRRHKIFDPVTNKSNSVSPQPMNRPVSPISSLTTTTTPNNITSSKIINPLTKSKPQELKKEERSQRF